MITTGLFEYKILSKYYLNEPQNVQDFQEVYQFWRRVWTEMLTKAGCPDALVVDEFYRADLIPVIKYQGRIIGASCSTVFDLRNPAIKDMKYFSIFPEHAKQWMARHNPRHVMTIEWLCVDKEFRSSVLGYSLGEVMIQLSYKLMQELNVDMNTGVTVKIAGVDKLATNLGAEPIGDGVKRGSLDCCIVGILKDNVLKVHPDATMNGVINSLWNSREYSFKIENSLIRKAA